MRRFMYHVSSGTYAILSMSATWARANTIHLFLHATGPSRRSNSRVRREHRMPQSAHHLSAAYAMGRRWATAARGHSRENKAGPQESVTEMQAAGRGQGNTIHSDLAAALTATLASSLLMISILSAIRRWCAGWRRRTTSRRRRRDCEGACSRTIQAAPTELVCSVAVGQRGS